MGESLAVVGVQVHAGMAKMSIRAYIGADRETLYFESGPLEPLGNLDLYVATRSKKGHCD